jgi:hypothetical protein
MTSKSRFLHVALVGALGFTLLTGCGSDGNENSTSSSTATANSDESSPAPLPTNSPNPSQTLTEPDLEAQPSDLSKDPNWVADSQLLAWPDPFPTWKLSDYSDSQVESAIKEAVTFTTVVGWNDSLMDPNTSPSLAKTAFAPYATSNALELWDKKSKGYLEINQSIADGRNVLKYFNKAQLESETQAFTDWFDMSALMSFSVPYFVPFGEVRQYPDGTSTGRPNSNWKIKSVIADKNGEAIWIDMLVKRYVEVQGNPIFTNGDVLIYRDVQLKLVPNPVATPGMPWLIDDWTSLALSDEESLKYLYDGKNLVQGPVKEFTGF